MKSLLIDTSSQMLSVAINHNEEVIAEINTNVKVNHSETLMVYIGQLFEIARISRSDIERIIVARGPGSYTGLRIGVTVSKVLAQQLNIPLYSVSSLFAMYVSSRIYDKAVYPIIDARRGSVFVAGYHNQDVVLEPQHMELSKLKQDDTAIIIGTLSDKISSSIEGFRHVQTRIADVERFDAQLKQEDIHGFVPEYLRLSEAEANWKLQSEQ